MSWPHPTGVIAAGRIRFNGLWEYTDTVHRSLSCTEVATAGEYVLCYDRQSGILEILYIDERGYVALPKGWSHIVATAR